MCDKIGCRYFLYKITINYLFKIRSVEEWEGALSKLWENRVR
jgi:hypothetical protein